MHRLLIFPAYTSSFSVIKPLGYIGYIKPKQVIFSIGERINSNKVKVQWYSRVEDIPPNHLKDIPEGKKHISVSIYVKQTYHPYHQDLAS